eukprot:TRINITY_DN55429_c0_g1_i1.p1 TRINITY_DN55429_c0_g1~~TRINITY_DN55429_c0_g1_i1.p1  ORF type:complete len:474 (+),score=45.30 TRINITY_DN55429_c0_g1_i1:47-1423(+)
MGRLTILGACAVLTNNILGPGVLGLPWAVAQGGFGLGTCLFILSAFTGVAGMFFLGAAAMHAREYLPPGENLTLASACRLVDARELRFALDLGLVLSCSGALITSLIIIGDSLEPLGVATREALIAGVFFMVAFPLSFFSQISFLRFSSYLSFCMMVYLAALMFQRTTSGSCPTNHGSPASNFRFDNMEKIFQTIPVFTFCFCGHQSIFSIASELEQVSVKRMTTVICIATGAATFIFGTVSSSVVLCFGDMTPQDLLSNSGTSASVLIARGGMAVVCCGFFPLLVQPVRNTCMSWIESAMTMGFNRQISPIVTPSHRAFLDGDITEIDMKVGYMKAVRHSLRLSYHVVTILVGLIALGIALTTKSLGVVFSLSGATGFALLCNICPPWLYLMLAPKEGDRFVRCAAWALLAYGVIMMPVCITANFLAALPRGDNEAAQCILPPSCNVKAFCSGHGGP